MEEINETNELELRKGIIYCIVCNVTGEKYYGSTFKSINDRIKNHKKIKSKGGCTSKQIIERGNYSVQNLMEVYVPNKLELHKLEANFIKNNDCVNERLPYLTEEEKIMFKKQCDKKYYEKNKDTILEKQKEYYNKNKEKIYEKHYHYQINYRIKNCETVNLKQREYRTKQPIVCCECGSEIKKLYMSQHNKSKKHQDYLRQQQQDN